MDGLAVFLLCVRTIPFYLQKRREDEDEEGKRSEGKGIKEKKRW